MHRCLTLIVAPAGYGKTTLAGEWLTTISNLGWPVACITLDEYDNHLLRFWSYVVAALQDIHPSLQYDIMEFWRNNCDEENCTLLNPLINEIADIPHQFSLVLDDYHEIKDPAIHRTLAYLIDHLPGNCHLTLISRVMPPLLLSRLRARGQLTEIYAQDLCFTFDETHTFLSSVMNLDISWDEAVSLKEMTEGWIAGLKLSALSLQGKRDAKNFIANFTGSFRHILDYLTDEVLNQQDEETKEFLLKTSILTELSAPLCDVILGQKNSQKMLTYLEQANLFIVPIDDQQHWYRYHALFADLLRIRLRQTEPDLLPQLNMAACLWLKENGYPEKSVFHALAAGETEMAADIVETCALKAIIDMDLTTVFQWFNRLPPNLVKVRPRLMLYSSLANLVLGKTDYLEEQLNVVEENLREAQHDQILQEEKERMYRYINAVRAAAACTRGDTSGGIRSAQQVLGNLLPEDYFFLGLIEHFLAYAYQAAGKLAEGAAAQERACQNALSHNFHIEFVLSQSEKARFYRLQGRLRAAADAYHQAADYANQHCLDLGVRLIPQTGLADIYREWNKIQEADNLLSEPISFLQSLQHAHLEWFYSVDACLTIAKNRILHSEFDQADKCIQMARRLAQVYHYIPDLFAEVSAVQVQLRLAQGNLQQAIGWTNRKEREALEQSTEINTVERIVMARTYLALDRPDQASFILSKLLAELDGSERGGCFIEALILQAQALWQDGYTSPATKMLDRALNIAGPEGRIRSFIDCGESMNDLLSHRLALFERQTLPAKQEPARIYLQRLLEAYGSKVEEDTVTKTPNLTSKVMFSPVVEPLSERELEVLGLLAKGYSSGEIARRLIISVNTAKAHIKSIYQKLDVHSRKEAIEMAISLHLLGEEG